MEKVYKKKRAGGKRRAIVRYRQPRFSSFYGKIVKRKIEITFPVCMFTDGSGVGYYTFNTNGTLALQKDIGAAMILIKEFTNMANSYNYMKLTGIKLHYKSSFNVSAFTVVVNTPECYFDICSNPAAGFDRFSTGRSETSMKCIPASNINASKYYPLPDIVGSNGYISCGNTVWNNSRTITANALGSLVIGLGHNNTGQGTATQNVRLGDLECVLYTTWAKPMVDTNA